MHSTTPLDPTSDQLEQEEQNDFAKFGSFLKENIGQHLREKCLDFTLSNSTNLSAETDPQYAVPVFPTTLPTSSSTINNSALLQTTIQPCHEQDQNIVRSHSRNAFDSAGWSSSFFPFNLLNLDQKN